VWNTKTPLAEIVGTGPFVLKEYTPGQRLVFERNPYYWKKDAGQVLPRLDRIVLDVVPDQNAELLRLTSGDIDLMERELRPDDYLAAKRAADDGRLALIELGVRADADAFWFCLKADAKKHDPRFAFVRKKEFRQAISHAVDRQRFADTVFFGAAVPVWGPITPGNKRWYWDDVPRYDFDPNRAKALLKSIGLEDRNGNGTVEDAQGTEARFTVITQRGVTAFERGTAVLKESAAKIGIALDIAPLEFNTMVERMLASNYDAIYMLPATSDLDPALNKDLWLSSGDAHFWDLAQKAPSTEWERRIDDLMHTQAASLDPERRRALFNDVQRIFAENVPVLYFAAPKIFYATNPRVRGAIPSVMRPPVLWNADSLSVIGATSAGK
jgi:peptide/nickel transport system substrate-binding protein